jgi:AGZA family xanthine/uracil permease-like MFS transporter
VEAALGAVFISGCLFLLVTLFRVREMIVNGIPRAARGITAGIGLFLAIIALKNAASSGQPATLVTIGDLHQTSAILAVIGFFAIVALDHLKVKAPS